MAQLVCRDLSLGYGASVLVSGLNFEVNAGDYLCVVGENGSGKSTLVRTMLGLQPPVRGVAAMEEGLRADEVGYLPQQTAMQRDFPASVREVVLSGCQGRCGLRPFYSREERRLAEGAMQRMGISGLARRCYRELSGGQQQRVLLARALCAARKALFLDEPVSGLDPQAGMEMYRVIETLNREEGVTVVMVSHDVASALKYASHILRLGEAVFFGAKEEYNREYQERQGVRS
ncbi:MAG: ABC transporter ATP-binding protein [Fretibacterium sp.]|nr:ABC transporter ATP-binding protein [Fretibacterium sp.]